MTGAQQLPLNPPPGSVHRVGVGTIRLLVFNAQHAAPARARRQAAWIGGQQAADLVIITEVGPGPGGHALTDALAGHGYLSVVAPEPSPADYRTVIASRGPDLTTVPSGIAVLAHRGPAVAVSVAGRTIGLLGLYVPSRGPKDRRNEAKRAFQRAVTQALPGFVALFDGPVIVAGDLNVVEPGHSPHHPVFGGWEYDFYRSFTSAGLADAYRLLHPDAAGHSWYGRSGQGYRFDHAFITSRHRAQVRDCGYLHEPRQRGLTDHAAMTLTVGVAAAQSGLSLRAAGDRADDDPDGVDVVVGLVQVFVRGGGVERDRVAGAARQEPGRWFPLRHARHPPPQHPGLQALTTRRYPAWPGTAWPCRVLRSSLQAG
jgi:exodeoxyribonuclease III